MFCSSCGKPVKDTDQFCESCGASLKEPQTDAPAEADAAVAADTSTETAADTHAAMSADAPADADAPTEADAPTDAPTDAGAAQGPAQQSPASPRSESKKDTAPLPPVIAPSTQDRAPAVVEVIPGANQASSARRPSKIVIAAVAVVVLLAAVGAGVGATLLVTTPLTSDTPPVTEPVDDETPGPQDAPPKLPEPEKPEQSKDEVPVQSSLVAYSWSDLAALARQIEQVPDAQEAAAMAARYHLSDATGSPASETKSIMLPNGVVLGVQLVGVLHDDKADGSGKAAMTFMTTGSYANHSMNDTATNAGGWEGSQMRAWLNDDVLKQLPAEVRDGVVPVEKLTNNVGPAATPDVVSATTDTLWLYSWTELFGTITWNIQADTFYIDGILNEEGTQYRFFADSGLADAQISDTAGVLKKYEIGDGTTLSSWWVRSAAPNRDDGFGDVNNGGHDNGGLATSAQGVVFGFCL